MSLHSRLLAAALVCALAGLAPAAAGVPGPTVGASTDEAAPDQPEDPSTRPGQTSEGVRGEVVDPAPLARLGRVRIANQARWQVSPGVTYRRWDRTDRRGPVRAHLLRVDPAQQGITLDYASGRHVPDRHPLTNLLRRDDAVAGINGGFFDISDTGAPLGVGQDRQRGMLHASRHTWYNAFYLTRDGVPKIRAKRLVATIDQYPQLEVTNVNSPRVRAGKIGVYDESWGVTSGYSVTDGQKKGVRMVLIQDGRVQASRTTLNRDQPIDGVMLIGRGPGADQLAQLRVGSLATVRWRLAGDPTVAISGERILLRDGALRVANDRELHPRTAIGIDRDTGRILMLVVDGRQRHSRGYTLVELARTMRNLGAEDALNLDGGGSSTLVAADRAGDVRVLNAPSDGSQRKLPDGIGVTYTAPTG